MLAESISEETGSTGTSLAQETTGTKQGTLGETEASPATSSRSFNGDGKIGSTAVRDLPTLKLPVERESTRWGTLINLLLVPDDADVDLLNLRYGGWRCQLIFWAPRSSFIVTATSPDGLCKRL